jgi:release factor glutamine methyltransferase
VAGPTPAELVRRSAAYLERHGVDSPTANAETLLMHVLGTDRAGLYARREGLDTQSALLFGRALCRRCAGTPLQHLTGEQAFLDRTLTVRPGVFVPRPETEVVATAALEVIAGRAAPVVVDVGTGTGAIAVSLAGRRPDANVSATDVSPDAVALARENARRLGVRVDVREGDLLSPLDPALRGAVDLIVSNPPYLTEAEYADLPPEVRRDPFDALVGSTEVHARLAADARAWLQPGGWLVLEIGDAQGSEVRALLADAGFEDVSVRQDLNGRDRVAAGRLPAVVAATDTAGS